MQQAAKGRCIVRTIIAGSRLIINRAHLEAALQACPWTRAIASVVCGGATGIDQLGDKWALVSGLPVRYFLVTSEGKFDYDRLVNLSPSRDNAEIVADWYHNGPAAGPMRNRAMAANADALIAVPLRGRSRGTDSMIHEATKRGLKIFVREVEP
jgi:hypothetical protein